MNEVVSSTANGIFYANLLLMAGPMAGGALIGAVLMGPAVGAGLDMKTGAAYGYPQSISLSACGSDVRRKNKE